jgi:uncharacterized protein
MPAKLRSRVRTDVDLEAAGRQVGRLYVPHSSQESAYGAVTSPFACIAGAQGPTVLLTAGNHGDEYEGQIALLKLLHRMDPADVHGRILVLPSLNLPAALAGRRSSPVDGGNLNRSFPGDPSGGVTSALAHFIDTELLPRSQFALDLHSGGSSLEYLPCGMARASDDAGTRRRILEALQAFGAPYSFVFETAPDERTLTAAGLRQGVLHIGAEIGGGGTTRPATLAVAEQGVHNFLVFAGVLRADPQSPASSRVLAVHGADYLRAPVRGFFEPVFELGDEVDARQLAGRIHFPEEPSRTPAEVHFATTGTVVCRRVPTRCLPGDCLAHLAS